MSTDPSNPMDPAVQAVPPGSASDTLRAVLRFLRLLRRRQGMITWLIAGCLAIATGYYAVAPRYYESTAKLLVQQQNGDRISTVGDGGLAMKGVLETHQELVTSPRVVQHAVDGLAPEHRIDLQDRPPRAWVNVVRNKLVATAGRNTQYITVHYESRSPDAAAAVVNAVIGSYLQFVAENHRGTAAEMSDVLNSEMSKLQLRLETKQQELQAARKKIGHLAINQEEGAVDPTISRAIFLNNSLMEARQQRLELQASLATVQRAIQQKQDLRSHLAAIQEVVGEQMMLNALGLGAQDMEMLSKQQEQLMDSEAKLRQLSPFYGPSHPTIVALNDQIKATRQYVNSYHSQVGSRFDSMAAEELGPLLTNTLMQSVAQAWDREQQLSTSFEQARNEASLQSDELVRIDELERDIARLEAQYDVMFEKVATIDIHQVQAPLRASIVQEPLPNPHPVSPKVGVLFAGAILTGLMLGAAVVFVQDLLDDRFGSPDEMSLQLGLPVLSLVRQMQPSDKTGLDAVQMYASPDSVDCEAFRTLRTSLSLTGDVAERLAISSAEPSDGKTTITSNLAVAYAQTGKRTLVIDSDLRKPGMTALMGLRGAPGVTDILAAGPDLGTLAEQCLHHTDMQGLDVIPAGPRRADAAELLSGPQFSDLLAWAESRYDQVLVDCPPVLAVSDAQIIGRLVDGMVVVVTPEKNHRRLVSRACETFLAGGINVLGVVANRITEKSNEGYGYGYGYGYGHEAEDEPSATEQDRTQAISSTSSEEVLGTASAWRKLVDRDEESPNERAA